MPRPRIRPEDRQRAAKACISCKAMKKRCDSQLPCSNCIRRECALTCTYTTSRRHSSLQPHAHEQQSRNVNSNATILEEEGSLVADEQYATPTPSDVNLTVESDRTMSSTSAPQRTISRMLLNSKGEKVYIGEVASLSFLHFLVTTLRHQMGPSSFTENKRRHVMLEADTPSGMAEPIFEDVAQRSALIDMYLTATCGILDLYTTEEFGEILSRIDIVRGKGDIQDLAAIYLAIAIGGQCRGSNPSDLQYATTYFSRGQQAAFQGMLEDPSINLVRIFLLMAFYMLGACRRNAAFMYIGVASKAATALGLHVAEQYRCFGKEDRCKRLRTWKSLYILDLLVTSILGRPCASPIIQFDVGMCNEINENAGDARAQASNATFSACSLINDMVQSLSQGRNVEVSSAIGFLQRLGDWSRDLPIRLREFHEAGTNLHTMDHELAIGCIHVACVYYFAVILITRPFLITYLMPQISQGLRRDLGVESIEESEVSQLAHVCMDSTVYMAQMCRKALDLNLLLGNMCMLKAWMFAAGLVLGFAIFAKGDGTCDMEEAFVDTREVLKKLSSHSPQAQEYYEILTNFSDAICSNRRQLSSKKRQLSKQYVKQLFRFDRNQELNDSCEPITPNGLPPSETCAPDASRYEGLGRNFLPVQLDGGIDYGLNYWNSPSIQIPESLSFDVEPFGMFFETI